MKSKLLTRLLLVVLVAVVSAGRVIAQDEAEVRPPAAPITEREVAAWIEQLDADQFLDRETATENLVAAGAVAVQPLLDVMRSGPQLERDMRAVFVLKQLALSADPSIEGAAGDALAQVAALRPGPASQVAIETLATLSTIREKRALDELVALGAERRLDPTDALGPFGDKYSLNIADAWKGRDEDLRRLRFLQNMTQLTLSGEKVKNEWLSQIREAVQLRFISINRAPISDEALANIAALPQLRIVELKYVPVGDASIDHLAKLKNVAMMRLYGTSMTMDAAEQLRQRLGPGVEVDFRMGAFLGISAGIHELGCMITDVRQRTAASSAGLMLGDIIVTYNGERVDDFEGLTKLISQNRPKDEVQLQFVRNVEIRSGIRVRRDDDELGMTGRDHPLGCEVTEVAGGRSIAAFLQVRKGDIIYQVNNLPVTRTQDLEQLVDAVKVGEPLTFDFARGTDIRQVKVTLGEWE